MKWRNKIQKICWSCNLYQEAQNRIDLKKSEQKIADDDN